MAQVKSSIGSPSRNGIMYHDSITSGGLCTRLRILGRVGRVALPTPTRFRDCLAPCKRTSPKLPRHCEPHSGTPQGGLSCPTGNSPSGNLLVLRMCSHILPGDSHGLRPRNDGGCRTLFYLFHAGNHPTWSAGAVPPALQKAPESSVYPVPSGAIFII